MHHNEGFYLTQDSWFNHYNLLYHINCLFYVDLIMNIKNLNAWKILNDRSNIYQLLPKLNCLIHHIVFFQASLSRYTTDQKALYDRCIGFI